MAFLFFPTAEFMLSLLAGQAAVEVGAASAAEEEEVVSAAGMVALEVVLVSLTSMFPFPSTSPVLVLRHCPSSPLSCTCAFSICSGK